MTLTLYKSIPDHKRPNEIVRAHGFLCKQGRPQCTFRMTCASERSGSAHSIRHVHFQVKPLHTSSNLCKQGGGFCTSFSCARTIIGQRTLTKVINHLALFFCTCTPFTTTNFDMERGPQQLSWAEKQWSKYPWELSKKNSKPRSKTMALEFLRARYFQLVS